MNPALVVLNPRRITRALDAISALSIPRIWLKNFPEPALGRAMTEAIGKTDYTHYLVLSDDGVPTQRSLDLVLDLMEGFAKKRYRGFAPAATGYSNIYQGEPQVNLCADPLPPGPPSHGSYSLWYRHAVEDFAFPEVPTTFMGLCLSGMSRSAWLNYQLETYPSYDCCSDYYLSWKLARDGIPIFAARGAFVEHLKERPAEPGEIRIRDPSELDQYAVLVGVEPAEIVYEI